MTPHPCMTDFLQAYKANPEIRGFYDGNHIITSNTDPTDLTYSRIEDWGYDHLVSSFNQMTEWEKEILKDYFKRYEQLYPN